jgi:N-alpha-acetyl-L-2,4-diaminobutyrate deacetylase
MINTTLDFNKPGKQQGFLQVPYSHNLGGWANVMIPITIVARGKGPTVLVLGGNHGDEYQGKIAIMKLARELTSEKVSPPHTPSPLHVQGQLDAPPQKQFIRRSTRLKPNLPPVLPLLSRVFRIRLLHLPDLPLQHLLRHPPLRRIRISAPCMSRVDATVQDIASLV